MSRAVLVLLLAPLGAALAQLTGRRVPATMSDSDAVGWAEEIMKAIDERQPK